MKQRVFVILFILISVFAYSQKKQKMFIDTLDNAFDISYYMYNLHGLLPIVSPITEPAVGFGAALATVYFIPKKKNDSIVFQMPDIVALVGGLTENRTWFAGAAYLGFWKQDRIRYRGIFGYGDVKLKYYGKGNNFLQKYPIDFSLTSTFFLQQFMFRVSNTRFMLGGKYIYSKSNVTIFENEDMKWIDPVDIDVQNSGIGVIAEYENYDNILSPNKGLRLNVNYLQFAKILGGDRDFGRLTSFLHYYIPTIKNKLNSGLRLETQFATGDAPFYMKPFVYMRGIPAMRYQGEITALAETEQLFLLTRRWGLVGFGGIATTYNSEENINNLPLVWNYGAGFRYLIARQLGLRMGIDVAKSNDDWGIYIIFGSAWIK